jgi:monofunctional glycosyltransferase
MPKEGTSGRRRSPSRRLARWLILGPILVVAGFIGVCTLATVLYRWVPPPVTTVQLQRSAAMVTSPSSFAFSRSWKRIDDISPHLRHAVIAAEDNRFYQHRGFDWEEFQKARRQAERTGRPMRGASTISQQLTKNLFLTTHRSYARKGLEYPLTFVAEVVLPKDRILELYLNVVEWGPGVYGAEAAAQYHYGVSASRLTREQSARLAAVLPAPRSRTPSNVGGYAGIIMRRMSQLGY